MIYPESLTNCLKTVFLVSSPSGGHLVSNAAAQNSLPLAECCFPKAMCYITNIPGILIYRLNRNPSFLFLALVTVM